MKEWGSKNRWLSIIYRKCTPGEEVEILVVKAGNKFDMEKSKHLLHNHLIVSL